MKYADFHVHHFPANGRLDARELLTAMDRADVEKIVLMSWYGKDLAEQAGNIDRVAEVVSVCPERLYGLAWVEPRHNTPLDYLEEVIGRKKFRGFKMIPNKWYPYDDALFPYYEKMAQLGTPCLFHSGILYFPTHSSKYCRPVYFEDLIRVPKFRFALAHISWPWTDECTALFGQWRNAVQAEGATSEMFIDTTPGTPPAYRLNALEKLVGFGAEDAMLFGTDFLIPSPDLAGEALCRTWQSRIRSDLDIYRQLSVSENTAGKIFRTNFDRFFAAP